MNYEDGVQEITKMPRRARGMSVFQTEVEKIQNRYPLIESADEHEEELREAVKLYGTETHVLSYLAADTLSVIGHLSNYKNEFIRIFVFDENNKLDFQKISREIRNIIPS